MFCSSSFIPPPPWLRLPSKLTSLPLSLHLQPHLRSLFVHSPDPFLIKGSSARTFVHFSSLLLYDPILPRFSALSSFLTKKSRWLGLTHTPSFPHTHLHSKSIHTAKPSFSTTTALLPPLISEASEHSLTEPHPFFFNELNKSSSSSTLPPTPSKFLNTSGLNTISPEKLREVTKKATDTLQHWKNIRPSLEDDLTLKTQIFLHQALLCHYRVKDYSMMESLLKLSDEAQLPFSTPLQNDRLLTLTSYPSMDAALAHYQRGEKEGWVNEYSVSMMVQGYVGHLFPDKAHALVKTYEKTHPTTSLPQPVYTSLMKGYYQLRQLEKVWEVYEHMMVYHWLPDQITLTLLMSACLKSNQYEKVLFYFDVVRQRGLLPTTMTMNKVFVALSHLPNYVTRSVAVLKECLALGFQPDAYTWISLMQSARTLGSWTPMGQYLWDQIPEPQRTTECKVQCLWTIHEEQQRLQGTSRIKVPDALVPTPLSSPTEDPLHLCIDWCTAYLSTLSPNDALTYFQEQLSHKHAMTYRVLFSLCIDDPTLRPTLAQVWKDFDTWLTQVTQASMHHASPSYYLKLHHRVCPTMLVHILKVFVNGIAMDHPKLALALILDYTKRYQLSIYPTLFPNVKQALTLSGDPSLLETWNYLFQTYGQPKSKVHEVLEKRKWGARPLTKGRRGVKKLDPLDPEFIRDPRNELSSFHEVKEKC